ncbi:subclass B1 metallo-beta-lactamase [Psychrobium sp. MM17-31]|uniref:subclass B1 metallo-beta-lactamase n=1 Tax=Psychrobium sp. MM17-31 TaxID=2917758 RepID=UPI001EF540F6|nr:subclass B1 metallo-beta-lactamase [Psychrobium sp. MM17-31]MCG7533179.1 subclass B1 metallo-beta-lactamase [Psychrobium sp. MM17-31]
MKSVLLGLLLIPSLVFAYSQGVNPQQAKNIKIKQLSDNVYQHISYKEVKPWGLVAASGLVVVNGADAHLIDTPWTTDATKELLAWIDAKELTVKSATVTHFHDDASGDLPLLNELKIPTYATTLTNKLLKLDSKQVSTHEITNSEFTLIDGVMEVFYPGAGHTKDNVVVWLPKEKMLFGGCFVKSLGSKHLGYTGDAVIADWPSSVDKVLKRYPAIERVVPGHGKVGDASLLTHTKKLAVTAKTAK